MKPEQIKQEQERVLARINAYDTALAEIRRLSDGRTVCYAELAKAAEEKGEVWPSIPYPTPEYWAAWEAWEAAQKDLPDPTLARAYAALLDAHLALRAQLAQAEEREAALRDAVQHWKSKEEANRRSGDKRGEIIYGAVVLRAQNVLHGVESDEALEGGRL